MSYTVDANGGAARTGTITAGGQSYTVSQAAPPTSPGCSTATVLAAATPPPGVPGVDGMWQSTGVTLTAGQPVTVTATGTWSSAGVALTAAGQSSTPVTGSDCPLSGAPLLALIGRIGPTGTPFLIGTTRSWSPTTSGVLYLAPQDNWYSVSDNAGSLSVSVCLGASGGCTFALNPTSSGTLDSAGGSGSFTVTTDASCSWTATTASSWIHVTAGSGTGPGTVSYTVDANGGAARTGTITAGGQSYTVSQAASPASPGCSTATVVAAATPPPGVPGVDGMWQSTGVTLTAGQPVTVTATGTWSSAGVALTAAGQSSTMVTGADCPLSGAPLLALIGRIGPTGTPFLIGTTRSWTPTTSGVLYLAPQDNWYTVSDNAGSLSVSVCLGASGGCTFALNPTSSGTLDSAGGSGSFTVTTDASCSWTATTASPWIHITSGAGPGSATVAYAIDVNPGTARVGTIAVGDQSYTVTQAADPLASCATATVLAAPTPPPGVAGVDGLWQSTGVTLTAGQPVTVTASGTWNNSGVVLTAAGHPTSTVTGTDCPLSGAPLLALIGRIGPTGAPFLVGTGQAFTPATSRSVVSGTERELVPHLAELRQSERLRVSGCRRRVRLRR